MHIIPPTGRFLFLCKTIDSPSCVLCSQEEETISDWIYECTKSQFTRNNLPKNVSTANLLNLHKSVVVLCVCVCLLVFWCPTECIHRQGVGLKWFVIHVLYYKRIWQETAPTLKVLQGHVYCSVTVEIIFTCVYTTTDRLHDFDLQWPPYKGLII